LTTAPLILFVPTNSIRCSFLRPILELIVSNVSV
jgi:hypothetical protein